MTRYTVAFLASLALLAPVRADDEEEMRTAYRSGNQFLRAGKVDEAEKAFLHSLELAIGLYGEENIAPATALDALGRLYLDTGRSEKAAEYHGRSLKVRRALKPGTADEAVAQSGLGLALQSLGKYADAEDHLTAALAIRQRLTPGGVEEAQESTNLGTLCRELGRFPEAEKLHGRALEIMKAKLPADHPYIGMVQNNLANVYLNVGKYEAAEELFRQVLATLQKADGVNPVDIGGVLMNLGMISRKAGRYPEAGRYLRDSMAVFEKVPGNGAVHLSNAVTALGNLYFDQGRYADAEAAHRRALKLRQDNLPAGHALIAGSLTNLGVLLDTRGQPAEARSLFQEALDLRVKAFKTENHPAVGESLNNLASVEKRLGHAREATDLYRRAIAVQKAVNPKGVEYAEARFNLATMDDEAGRVADGEAGYREAIAVFDAAFGKDHPHSADSRHNLAILLLRQGKAAEARGMFHREYEVAQKAFGPDHPSALRALGSLALVSVSQGKTAEAVSYFDDQRRGLRRFLLRELPFMSEREQRDLLAEQDSDLAVALTVARDSKEAAVVRRAAEWLLNAKGVAQEARTLRARLDRELTDKESTKTVAEVHDLRSREAALALQETGLAADAVRKQREELAGRRRELERSLMAAGGPAAGLAREWVELDAVRAAMPNNSLLVEIVQLKPPPRGTATTSGPARYVAWVVPKAGDVTVEDLGDAAGTDAAVKAAREAIVAGPKRAKEVGEPKAEAEARAALGELAKRILHPLAPHLKGVEQLILSPDGDLWLAPWAALPLNDQKYLVEAVVPRFVVSGRDLLPPATESKAKPTAPLVLADPDFDAALAARPLSVAGRTAAGRLADFDVRFQFVPGGSLVIRFPGGQVIGTGTWTQDGADVRMETETSKYAGRVDGRELKGERRFKEGDTPPQPFALDLAALDGGTRAGALGKAERLPWTGAEAEAAATGLKKATGDAPTVLTDAEATEGAAKAAARPRMLVVASHGFFLPVKSAADDPLTRCGLLLAGCNREQSGPEDGVLTGHEVVGLDLRGTELVVLSACETGVGVPNTGDGVAGLRQAFQLAGAGGVLASLWRVPDQETAAQMTRFYAALADKKGAAEALALVQRDAIAARWEGRSAAHAFYWAAFTFTGRQ